MKIEFDNLFLAFRILCPLIFVSKYFTYFSNHIYIRTNVVGLRSFNFLKSILKLILKPNFNRFSPIVTSLC